MVQPIDLTDIQAALIWAREENIDIAVKGGGHSTAGTGSSEGGLVIDLFRMNKVTVDRSSKTITAQGGATWKEVVDGGAIHGLVTVGGTVNHTASAGSPWVLGMAGYRVSLA